MAKVDTEIADIDDNEVNTKQWVPKETVLEILRENRTQCGITMLGLLVIDFSDYLEDIDC